LCQYSSQYCLCNKVSKYRFDPVLLIEGRYNKVSIS
jgi:hypothetical protein